MAQSEQEVDLLRSERPGVTDLENNSNQKKYTVNKTSGKKLVISKPLCTLMAIGAILLAVLVGLVVFFVVPRECNREKSPESLTSKVLEQEVFKEVDERLPRRIEPTHYRISLIPNLGNSTFSGSEKITLKALEETNEIIFHVNNISINDHSISIRSTKENSSPIEVTASNHLDGNRYKILLSQPMKTEDSYNLDLSFNGQLNSQLKGFFRTHYNERQSERTVLSTQFSPTDARRAFPCFDEPIFKSKFRISLARPGNMTSLSNMPLAKTTPFEGRQGWFWDHYPETSKMSTYLLAFMITDLHHGKSLDPLIKIWSRPYYVNQTMYAADIAPRMLHYFEDYFQIKYPLQKIDIVAVPEFGVSAMENWGLIAFRENSLLFDPETSTNNDKRGIATILSHEIAHQWFGNLVTPKSWSDLWLKEGFATYLQYFGVDNAEPSWKIVEEFLPSETERAMQIDALSTVRPISLEVKNSREIRETFDEISYAKGACIIRMMHHFLGDKVFRNGLINFLKQHQNGNADKDDLFSALTKEIRASSVTFPNETVKVIMDTWTNRPGFPVVHSIADYSKNKLKIFQRRFYLNGKEEKSSWWVPISFTTDRVANFSDSAPKFWLKGEYEIEAHVVLGQWYLLNINHTGYYIVNYDEQNWNSLSDRIMDLPPLTRAQLISDSMDLARANLLSYDIPLKMIAKMAVKDENIMIIPTIVALNKLQYLSDILSNSPAFGLFEEYHRAIFKQTYQKVTLDDGVEDYITRRIRSAVLEWSCRSPDSKCSHEARTKFRLWMIKGIRVEPNLRHIVYCTAVKEGGQIEWDFAYRKLMESNSLSEKNMLMDALGCTKLKWLLSSYLDKLLDNSIRIQDADRVFESVAKNDFGTSIAFNFLRKNWNELLEKYGDGFNVMAKMIKVLANRMSTEFQLSEFQRFRENLKSNISTTSTAFDGAIETIEANVHWMKKNYHQVDEWLNTHKQYYIYF